MKNLYIVTTDDSITIKNADDLQYQVSIKDGVIHFGREVGINIDCLISYQFKEEKEDENKKKTEDMVEDIKEKYKDLINYTGFACNSELEVLAIVPNVSRLNYEVAFKYKGIILSITIEIPTKKFGNMLEINRQGIYVREKIVEYLVKGNKI